MFDANGAVIAGNMAALPTQLARGEGPLVVDLVRSLPPDPVPNSSRAIACATNDGNRLVVAEDLDELDAIRVLIGRALAIVTLPAIAIAALFGVALGLRGQSRFRLVQGNAAPSSSRSTFARCSRMRPTSTSRSRTIAGSIWSSSPGRPRPWSPTATC